ncbi:collagen alpha-1(I) chain-like [Balaenoptera acutorostrata]|uniref:Collagen alpha-1(I) chain-like n=1 Tax=Balaenoptera acutorostrata TaxID=9767 RepID=A0ABM3TSU4_BALAC|nr:collagen alpha-1(I) chain-like [Balaenoptera acutorostrata]
MAGGGGGAKPRTTPLCPSARAPLQGTPRPSSRNEPDQVSPQTRPTAKETSGQRGSEPRPAPPARAASGTRLPAQELGACRSPTCAPSRPPSSRRQPIPAGSLPAQVTKGVVGRQGRAEQGIGRCRMPPARRVWGWGSRAVDLVSDSEKRGRDGRAGEGAGPTLRSRRPYKGPLGPAGGKCGRPQRRRAAGGRRAERRPGRRQELSRWAAARGEGPQCPRCGEVAGLAGGTGGRGDLPLAAAAVAPALPAQPGRGRLARTPAARSRQLLRECSKRSGSPWGEETPGARVPARRGGARPGPGERLPRPGRRRPAPRAARGANLGTAAGEGGRAAEFAGSAAVGPAGGAKLGYLRAPARSGLQQEVLRRPGAPAHMDFLRPRPAPGRTAAGGARGGGAAGRLKGQRAGRARALAALGRAAPPPGGRPGRGGGGGIPGPRVRGGGGRSTTPPCAPSANSWRATLRRALSRGRTREGQGRRPTPSRGVEPPVLGRPLPAAAALARGSLRDAGPSGAAGGSGCAASAAPTLRRPESGDVGAPLGEPRVAAPPARIPTRRTQALQFSWVSAHPVPGSGFIEATPSFNTNPSAYLRSPPGSLPGPQGGDHPGLEGSVGLFTITASQGDDSPGQRAQTSPATQGPGYPPAKAQHRPVRLGTSPRKAPAALPRKPSLLLFLVEPGDPLTKWLAAWPPGDKHPWLPGDPPGPLATPSTATAIFLAVILENHVIAELTLKPGVACSAQRHLALPARCPSSPAKPALGGIRLHQNWDQVCPAVNLGTDSQGSSPPASPRSPVGGNWTP